ncbi:MAG: hypothetical protein AAF171_02000 [Cyanobacteria bacterium P01_A01_bin.116]
MVLRAALKPVYLVLFSLTLLTVIAGSSAIMVIAGKGRDVFVFCAGMGVGLSLVSALSLELWQLTREYLVTLQARLIKMMAEVQMGEINPQLLLYRYATPQKASDIHLELECRRLLDRLHQLLERAVSEEGYCRHCDSWGEHKRDCPVPAAQQLYHSGKAKRLPWREYKKTLPKTLPADAIQ